MPNTYIRKLRAGPSRGSRDRGLGRTQTLCHSLQTTCHRSKGARGTGRRSCRRSRRACPR
eukprot:9662172-Heterocapsa_arctica.AAC.1